MVSIIIPVYNVEKYIRKCLESVINQTYKNIEIIIVNDGSRDNSRKIIDDILWMVKQVEIELNKDFLTLLENKNFRVYVVRWILANTIMKFEYFNYCYGFDKTKREFEYLRNNKVFIENTRILYKYRGNYKLKILLRVFYLRNLGWLKKFFLIRKNILKLKDIIIQK